MKCGIQWMGMAAAGWLVAGICSGAPILIDHRSTDITQLTETQINRAKAKLHIAYGHTSHGSQLVDGMSGLVDFANSGGRGLRLPRDIFVWNDGGSDGALDLHDYAMDGDVGYYPDWVRNTRAYLDDPANANVNVIVWSWCGQMPDKYSAGTLSSEYLLPMARLEKLYPHVVFVYMTGHVDIWNDAANKAACRVIRDWCAVKNRVLYDFNDIEHYDPDGRYYRYVGDDCGIYDGPGGTETGNWATRWQNSHVEGRDWYNCGSAHSQPLNANQKAYAAWALWCQIAASPILKVTPARRSVGAEAGTTSFRIVNRSGGSMRYRVSEASSWLRIRSGATGRNRGTVRLAFRSNPSTRARTGTVTVAASTGTRGSPRKVKIIQAGRPRSAKAAPNPVALARNGEGTWKPAPALVDGDTGTVWTGDSAGPWAVTIDFGKTIPLQDLDVQFAGAPWANAGWLGTADLQEWFDLRTIANWPVPCRAVYLDFRDDGPGAPPAIREIRWQ